MRQRPASELVARWQAAARTSVERGEWELASIRWATLTGVQAGTVVPDAAGLVRGLVVLDGR